MLELKSVQNKLFIYRENQEKVQRKPEHLMHIDIQPSYCKACTQIHAWIIEVFLKTKFLFLPILTYDKVLINIDYYSSDL